MKRLSVIALMLVLVGCSQPKTNLPPSPLPNGSSVLVSSVEAEGNFVYLVELNTGVVYSWEGLCPIWSTDGNQIAYRGIKHDEEYNVDYSIFIETDSAGSEIRSVVSDLLGAKGILKGSIKCILWYSDNQYVFSTSKGLAYNVQFYRYDGTGFVDLGVGNGAAISPDGEKILIDKITWSTLLSKDGKELGTFDFSIHANWSPDGKRIAFVDDQFSDEYNIFILDIASGVTTQLTANDGLEKFYPAWSPDGVNIAYLVADSLNSWRRNAIWIIGADGSNPKLLVEAANSLGGFSWSPDGKKIAYLLNNPEKTGTEEVIELHIMDVETGITTLIASFPSVLTIQFQP